MDNPTLNQQPIQRAAVPRAVWIGGALLCLVTAALAGALVMKSVGPAQVATANPEPMLSGANSNTAASTAPGRSTPVPAINDNLDPAPVPVAPRKPVVVASNRSAVPAAPVQQPAPEPAICRSCGTVESVSTIRVKGEGTGVGAVAGGVLGGVVGHQVGGGRGNTALTILGAVGGGLAGNEVEKRTRGETLYDVHVRMEDGSYRTVRQSSAVAVGTRVTVDGNRLRISLAAPEISNTIDMSRMAAANAVYTVAA